MSGNLPFLSFQVVLSVSRQIDLLVHSIGVKKVENCSFSAQLNSSLTNSLRMMTTKKFKRLFSNGFSTKTTMLSSKRLSKRNLKSASTTTCPISQLLLIVSDPAFKKVMRCQRTLLLSSAAICTNLILISSLSLLTYSRP